MNRPAVSVCMPTYNGERYLKDQLDSILAELGATDELIVVDDASRDGTVALLRDVAARDARVRLLPNERNMGVVKSVEKALSAALHEIILLSDQDDIWLPGKVDRALARLSDGSFVGVLSNCEIFVDDKRTGKFFFQETPLPRLNVARQYLKNDFIGCCMCFRKSILGTALPFPSVSMHDWWLGVNALAHGKVAYDAEPGILYRRHASNLTQMQRRGLAAVIHSRMKNFLAILCLYYRVAFG